MLGHAQHLLLHFFKWIKWIWCVAGGQEILLVLFVCRYSKGENRTKQSPKLAVYKKNWFQNTSAYTSLTVRLKQRAWQVLGKKHVLLGCCVSGMANSFIIWSKASRSNNILSAGCETQRSAEFIRIHNSLAFCLLRFLQAQLISSYFRYFLQLSVGLQYQPTKDIPTPQNRNHSASISPNRHLPEPLGSVLPSGR